MPHFDPNAVKLGRKPLIHKPTVKALSAYIDTSVLPPPPSARKWSEKVTAWPMMCNDKWGCCTIAASGHMRQLHSVYGGTSYVPTDAEIEAGYIAVTRQEGAAFDPATDANDNGCVETDVLDFVRKTKWAGTDVWAYVPVNFRRKREVEIAINLFCGVTLSVELPIAAQKQDRWVVTSGPDAVPGSWGGHEVIVPDYDTHGGACVTWGGLMGFDWGWLHKYGADMNAVLTHDWVDEARKSPNGFDLAQLEKDLAAIRHQ